MKIIYKSLSIDSHHVIKRLVQWKRDIRKKGNQRDLKPLLCYPKIGEHIHVINTKLLITNRLSMGITVWNIFTVGPNKIELPVQYTQRTGISLTLHCRFSSFFLLLTF